jgi:hypothetical protein
VHSLLGHAFCSLTCGFANRALSLLAKLQVRDMGVQLPLGVFRSGISALQAIIAASQPGHQVIAAGG